MSLKWKNRGMWGLNTIKGRVYLFRGIFFAFEVTRFLPVLYREVYDAESDV